MVLTINIDHLLTGFLNETVFYKMWELMVCICNSNDRLLEWVNLNTATHFLKDRRKKVKVCCRATNNAYLESTHVYQWAE
jgi:hypothetical protein